MPPCSEKQEMLFIAQASQSLACMECGKNEHPECFCISQGKRSLFPTAAASSAPFWLEPRRGKKKKADGEDSQEKNSSYSGFETDTGNL